MSTIEQKSSVNNTFSRSEIRLSKHFLLPWEYITSVAEISFPWFWSSYDLIDKMSHSSSSRYRFFLVFFTMKIFKHIEQLKICSKLSIHPPFRFFIYHFAIFALSHICPPLHPSFYVFQSKLKTSVHFTGIVFFFLPNYFTYLCFLSVL